MPAATVPEMVHSLDVSALRCPMTWVRTKLELERLESGQTLEVKLRPGEALENVPRSAREAGHTVAVDGEIVGSCAHERGFVARGLFRELAAAAARAALPDERREPVEAQAAAARRRRDGALQPPAVLPEWTEMSQIALRDASVLVIGAGALGSPVALYLAGAGVGRLGHRRRRRRRDLQPAPPAAALHARRGRAEGRVRGRQAALPQPRHRRRVLPDARRRDQRARADRGPGPGDRLQRHVRDPLRGQPGLLRRRHRPRRGRRGGVERAGDDDRPEAHRLLPLRVPDGARPARRRARRRASPGPSRA